MCRTSIIISHTPRCTQDLETLHNRVAHVYKSRNIFIPSNNNLQMKFKLRSQRFLRTMSSYESPNSYEFRSSQTFVEGGIITYGLLTMFVRPPLNSQEQLETFLRKWSAFRSYDCPRVLTFFVRVPWDLPTAYLYHLTIFVVARWSYGTLMCNSRHSQVIGRKILRLSAHFVGVYKWLPSTLENSCVRESHLLENLWKSLIFSRWQ